MKRKSLSIGYGRQARELHVEFPGGIVNITCGLRARHGRDVVSVSVSADGNRFAGDPEWWAKWGTTDKNGGGCRIIRLLEQDKPGKPPRGA
jgi:hypothetical protein